jgi:hypothetical protein
MTPKNTQSSIIPEHPRYLVVVGEKEGYAYAAINDAIAKMVEKGGSIYAKCFSAKDSLNLEDLEAHEIRRQIVDKEERERNEVKPVIKTRRKLSTRRPFLGIPENMWTKFHL